MCDVRIAAQSARIGFVFNRIGMLPELGSHTLLPRVVGFSNAAQLLMGAEIVDAELAHSMGLVSSVHPDEELVEEAINLANRLSAAAPVSIAATKKLLWKGLSLSWDEMHQMEEPVFEWVGRQPDSVEGINAFLEKRPANWTMNPYQDLPKELFD
jgi:enoyl-CoA hydratase/carnithine racemase